MYRKVSFNEYLQFIHEDTHPEILDDDLPREFDNWISNLESDDFMLLAGKYGLDMYLAGMDAARKIVFEEPLV